MKSHAHRTGLWLAIAGTALILLVLAFPTQAFAHGPSDGGASTSDINGLFTIVFWIALPIFLLVEGLILFAIVRYRRRGKLKGIEDMPEQVEGNALLEVTWTVLSFVVIAVVFILTYRFMTTKYDAEAQNDTGEPDYTVHVEGYMFNWDYVYFRGDDDETGVRTTRQLTLPADRLIRLEITSRDVQHSFWLPDLAGKVDAIPGYTNDMWLTIDEPGTYTGNCAEFCGTLHWDMIIDLEALAPDEFEVWLAEQEASAGEAMGQDMESELPPGDAARGEDIFHQLGCDACHGAEAGVGPALTGMGERAATREADDTAEHYLRESILMPCDFEVDGYNCTTMPSAYGESLDEQELADLIEYLLQN